jgi:hypothetical protein
MSRSAQTVQYQVPSHFYICLESYNFFSRIFHERMLFMSKYVSLIYVSKYKSHNDHPVVRRQNLTHVCASSRYLDTQQPVLGIIFCLQGGHYYSSCVNAGVQIYSFTSWTQSHLNTLICYVWFLRQEYDSRRQRFKVFSTQFQNNTTFVIQ